MEDTSACAVCRRDLEDRLEKKVNSVTFWKMVAIVVVIIATVAGIATGAHTRLTSFIEKHDDPVHIQWIRETMGNHSELLRTIVDLSHSMDKRLTGLERLTNGQTKQPAPNRQYDLPTGQDPGG
jgi:hypothetical protein